MSCDLEYNPNVQFSFEPQSLPGQKPEVVKPWMKEIEFNAWHEVATAREVLPRGADWLETPVVIIKSREKRTPSRDEVIVLTSQLGRVGFSYSSDDDGNFDFDSDTSFDLVRNYDYETEEWEEAPWTMSDTHEPNQLWHSDGLYRARTGAIPHIGLLVARQVLMVGGQTEFFNLSGLLKTFSQEQLALLAEITATYHYANQYFQSADDSKHQEFAAETPELSLPLLGPVNESGNREIYIPGHSVSKFTVGERDVTWIYNAILSHIKPSSPFFYRHQWSDGDVVIWNNLATMHRVLPSAGRRYLVHHETVREIQDIYPVSQVTDNV